MSCGPCQGHMPPHTMGTCCPMPTEFEILSPTRALVVYAGDISDADVETAQTRGMDFLRDVRNRGERAVMMIDGSTSNGVSAKQRRKMAEFNDANTSLLAAACEAQALVLSSTVQRGVLTAVLWIWKPPMTLKPFATRAEASAWLDTIEQQRLARSA